MTGFGRATDQNQRYRVTATARAVNHRFFDLALKLPETCREREPELRGRVAAAVRRGRVDLAIDISPLEAASAGFSVDREAAVQLQQAAQGLVEDGTVDGALTLSDLLRLPGVVIAANGEGDWGPDENELLDRVVQDALDQLLSARRVEGENLAAELVRRLDLLEELHSRLVDRRTEVEGELAASLEKRVREILGERELDEARLMQEVALLADRSNVSEELDRVRSHLQHFRQVMVEEEPVGKRLDFLAQELAREFNTLAAKSRDTTLVRGILDGKSLCEELREQVRNLE